MTGCIAGRLLIYWIVVNYRQTLVYWRRYRKLSIADRLLRLGQWKLASRSGRADGLKAKQGKARTRTLIDSECALSECVW